MNTIKVKNIAELKTRKGTLESTVEVLGYYTEGDGGGGNFYWDNTSTEADNGGTILSVTTISTGRWKRAYGNQVDVRYFGAKGDNINDDLASIQSSINFCKNSTSVNRLILTKGVYKISNTLNIVGSFSSGLFIEGNMAEIKPDFNGISVYIGSKLDPAPEYRKNLKIDGIVFNGNGTVNTSNVSLKIDEQADVFLSNCIIKGSYKGLELNGALICDIEYCTIRNNNFGIYAQGTIDFSPNLINFIGCRVIKNKSAIYWNGGAGNSFTNCEFEANNNSGTIDDGTIALNFVDAGNTTFINSWFESDRGSIGIKWRARSGYSNLTMINCEVIEECTTILDIDGNSSGNGIVTIIGGRIANSLATQEVLIGSNLYNITINSCNTNVYGTKSKLNRIQNGTFEIGDISSVGAYNAVSPKNNILTNGKGDTILHNFQNSAGTRLGYIGMTTGGAYIHTDGVVLPIIFETNGIERVRINSSGNTGFNVSNPQAIVDISSTTSGLLIPRMTTAQKNAIPSITNGLIVYDTTLNKLCVYESSAWKTVTTS